MSMTQEEVIALIKGIGGGGGGGTGEVISVNGKKGAVVLKAADIKDAENNTIQQRLDNTDENKQAKTDNSLETTAKTIVGAINEVNSKPPVMPKYLSVERLGNYLYKATFDTVPDYVDGNSTPVGGCSAFVRDGKLFRNFDWNYDNTATFFVKCKNFEGIGSIVGLNDSNLDPAKVGQLPYHIVDGVNTDGIMVSTHVLYNDFGYEGSGDKDKRIMGLPYFILSNVTTISNLETVIADYLANLNIPAELAAMEYLVQFIVTDGTTTKVITPKTDGSGYEVVDATDNPKLTNFKWVADATVVRTALQNRPTGVERWNLIGADTKLEDLRFTLAYESPTRLSEFIGIDGTTKASTDEELTEIYNEAHAEYLTRTRNGATWQTVHSVVYGAKGIESLFVQEDYAKDYIVKGGGASAWSDITGKPFNTVGGGLTVADNALKANVDDDTVALDSNGKLKVKDYSLGYTHLKPALVDEIQGKVNKTFEINGHNMQYGNIDLDAGDIGLGNVDNTSDDEKKANFTGVIDEGESGFVEGGEVYTALNDKQKKIEEVNIFTLWEDVVVGATALNWDKVKANPRGVKITIGTNETYNVSFNDNSSVRISNTIRLSSGVINVRTATIETNTGKVTGVSSNSLPSSGSYVSCAPKTHRTDLNTRTDLYNAVASLGVTTHYDYVTFNTASENPNGQSGASARFVIEVQYLNDGAFCIMTAINRAGNEMYICTGGNGTLPFSGFGAWKKIQTVTESSTSISGMTFHKKGNLVQMSGNNIAKDVILATTIPDGYRPVVQLQVVAGQFGGTTSPPITNILTINTNGTFTIYGSSSNLNMYFCWMTS